MEPVPKPVGPVWKMACGAGLTTLTRLKDKFADFQPTLYCYNVDSVCKLVNSVCYFSVLPEIRHTDRLMSSSGLL